MKKKLVSLLLVLGMVSSVFTGCGNAQKESKESSKNPSTSASEVVKQTEESKAKEAEEVVTVKWCIAANTQSDKDKVVEEMNKILRERYSLELDLEIIPNGEFANRMQLMSTSGEDYDLVFTSSWLNKYADCVAKETFLPLSDLLASDAGELLRSVLPEGLTDVAVVKGEFYAIPNYQLQYSQAAFYIQKDLVEKYELDVDSVKSIRDLEPFMEQIRDNEEGIWPIMGSGYSNPDKWLYHGYFDRFNSYAGVLLDDDEFKVQVVDQMEKMAENDKLVNEYFKRGFIRSDQATVVDDTADLAANRYAIICRGAVPGADAQFSATQGEEYISITVGEPAKSYTAGIETMTAINVNSKNPEAAIKMLGVLWSDKEIYNMMTYGLEGVHYKKLSENRIELIPDSGYCLSGYEWSFGNQFNAWLLPGQADDVWEVTKANNAAAPVSHLSGFTFDATNVKTELAQLDSVKAEYSGYLWADNYDEYIAERFAKMEKAGLSTVIAEAQRQVDEWRKANGK